MKKLLSAAIAALLLTTISCNTEEKGKTEADVGVNRDEEKNIAAYEVVNKAFETGDVSKIDSVVADDFLDHTDKGDIKGKDSLKAMITMMHKEMPDSKMETLQQVAKGDYVYGWMRYSGNSNGEMGMPKGPYKMQAMEVVKFSNGKAVEHWAFMEMQDMMKMMPAPAAPAKNK